MNQCDCGPIVVSDGRIGTGSPATCSGRSRVMGKTAQASSCAVGRRLGRRAVDAEHLGRGDRADQPVQVVAVGREIVGQRDQGRVELAGGGQVVDRLGQRAAQQQRPDAVDRRAGEVGVPRVDDPGGKLLARAALASGNSSAQNGTRGSTLTGSLVLWSGGL